MDCGGGGCRGGYAELGWEEEAVAAPEVPTEPETATLSAQLITRPLSCPKFDSI